MIGNIDRISYLIFGDLSKKRFSEYHKLEEQLLKSRICVPFDIYISRAYLISILSLLPLGILSYFLFSTIPGSPPFPYNLLIISLSSVIFSFALFKLIILYPEITANLRGRQIDIILPHAVALMHALSRGSNDILVSFEIISNNRKLFGEVSREVEGTLIEAKLLNNNIKTALKNSAAQTPSESFKNFLEGLSTILSSGGDVSAFFLNKSEQFRIKAINENKAYMETLGLFSEVYVTGFAVGPLFIIVLLVVLGLMGSMDYFLLYLMVYIFIPVGAFIFIILISSLSKGLNTGSIELESRTTVEEKHLRIQQGRFRMKINDIIQNPFKKLVEVPERVMFFSIPISIIFFIISTYDFFNIGFFEAINEIDDYIIFSVFIAIIPYSIFVEMHFRKIIQINENFPEFLNRLVSLHDSGLTIGTSLKKVGSTNLGILNNEINKMNIDLELRGNLTETFRNFGNRIKTMAVQRVVVLFENAVKMTGNIKDTLIITAQDAQISRNMDEDRIQSTRMHIYVLYIAFFVFLYVSWSIVTGFLPQMPDLPPEGVPDLGAGNIAFSGVDKALFIMLFFHASVIEGFFSGLMAGQIANQDARLGLKHSIVMTAIAYLLFRSIT
ncbi:MAG: type II secretion system F family protein [Candidatus Methanoperedens sp.]|nr:type II secretion system F family protein [Candidatus Methanoperedens sp.]